MADQVDQASDAYDTYLAYQLQSISNMVQNLQHNPVPSESHVYCIVCGEEIPKRRLEIFPNTMYCVECKERLEQKERESAYGTDTW